MRAPAPTSTTTTATTVAPTTATSPPSSSTLVIESRTEASLTENFNPFAVSSPLAQMGVPSYIYEPLVQYNELQIDQYYPWLASSWSLSSSGLTITFDLRAGVRWDDGSNFTASDVAYTFSILKQYPSLDEGIPIVSAEAANPSTFVLTLSRPGYSYLYDIARVPIVKTGYASGVNLRDYVDRAPDGTGPYFLAHPTNFSPRQVVLTARAGYWQGPPPVRLLVFPAFANDADVLAALQSGALDWADIELPGAGNEFVAKNKADNHFWAPPVASIALELNLKRPGFDKLAVRQAISRGHRPGGTFPTSRRRRGRTAQHAFRPRAAKGRSVPGAVGHPGRARSRR